MEMDQQFPRARVVRFEETRYTQVTNKTGFPVVFSLTETGEMCFSSVMTSTLPFDLFKNMAGISGLPPHKYLYLASCKILNKIATHTIFLNSFPLCCEPPLCTVCNCAIVILI